MNLWQRFEIAHYNGENRGLSLHFEKGVHPELRRLFMKLAKGLRARYAFPVHVSVYIKSSRKVILTDGSEAYGSFRWFDKRPPMIRIPAALDESRTDDPEQFDEILSSLIHELTHYYQWILKLDQTEAASEWQANHYRYRILDEALYNGR